MTETKRERQQKALEKFDRTFDIIQMRHDLGHKQLRSTFEFLMHSRAKS